MIYFMSHPVRMSFEDGLPPTLVVKEQNDIGQPTVVDFCLSSSNVSISCEGATNSFKVIAVKKIGANLDDIPSSIILDGVQVVNGGPKPEWLQINSLEDEPYPFPVPEGYEVLEGVVQFINLDTENHRLEFIQDPAQMLVLAYDNPTIVEFKDVVGQHIGVCLSYSDPPK